MSCEFSGKLHNPTGTFLGVRQPGLGHCGGFAQSRGKGINRGENEARLLPAPPECHQKSIWLSRGTHGQGSTLHFVCVGPTLSGAPARSGVLSFICGALVARLMLSKCLADQLVPVSTDRGMEAHRAVFPVEQRSLLLGAHSHAPGVAVFPESSHQQRLVLSASFCIRHTDGQTSGV